MLIKIIEVGWRTNVTVKWCLLTQGTSVQSQVIASRSSWHVLIGHLYTFNECLDVIHTKNMPFTAFYKSILFEWYSTNARGSDKILDSSCWYDNVIKWKHFLRYWPFVRGIHRSPVNFPHKGQWRGALIFYLICAWINCWINSHEAGDLRRHRAHYDVTVMNALQSADCPSWLRCIYHFHNSTTAYLTIPILKLLEPNVHLMYWQCVDS